MIEIAIRCDRCGEAAEFKTSEDDFSWAGAVSQRGFTSVQLVEFLYNIKNPGTIHSKAVERDGAVVNVFMCSACQKKLEDRMNQHVLRMSGTMKEFLGKKAEP